MDARHRKMADADVQCKRKAHGLFQAVIIHKITLKLRQTSLEVSLEFWQT